MRINALRCLLKVRKSSTDAAKLALAEAIAFETEASEKAAVADRRILDEAEAALALGAGDGVVEVYARWLPQGRRDASLARSNLERTQHDISVARTALALARGAEYAIAVEIDKAEAEIASMRALKAQSELDEIGARQASSRSKSGGS